MTHGLGVSRRYVDNVLKRFENSGDVATHQGQGADPMDKRALSRLEDWQIMRLIVESPRTTLKDHHAQFVLESGVIITYQAFCRAVARLGFSRKKIRSVAYQCDMQRADAFLAELLTFYCADELGVLDETSKELASRSRHKSGFGYLLRGITCTVQDTFLSHESLRVSALCLYTLADGLLDWAFTPGTFNKEFFLHVTTENFRDWRGVLRRPMLVRARQEPRTLAPSCGAPPYAA